MRANKLRSCSLTFIYLLFSIITAAQTVSDAAVIGKPLRTRLSSQIPNQAVSSGNHPQSDKITELALKLIEATADNERGSLLEKEKELVTEKLAQALLSQARIYLEKGDLEKALAVLHLAQSVAERIGDRLSLAQALTRAGNIYRMQGKYDRALDYLRRALPLHESLGNKPGIFHTVSFITAVNTFNGNYDLQLPQRMLTLAEESKNKEWLAISFSQIGAQNFALGNYAQAFHYHQKSLALYQELSNKAGIAFALHGIGNAYRMSGNYGQALSYFQKSLTTSEEIGSADLSIRSLVNLGALHRLEGNYLLAEEYLKRSITLIETSNIGNFSGNGFWLSLALVNLAEISRSRANHEEALAYLRQSVSLSTSSESKDPLSYALSRMAAVFSAQKDFTHALEAASRATAIAKQSGGRDAQWRAHFEAGKAHRALGQAPQARREFEEAISIIESVRADVLSNEARASYFATTQEPYEQYIDFLMQLHRQQPAGEYSALALHAVEKARARSLLDALAEAHADIGRGVDARLLEGERLLSQQLNAVAQRQTQLLSGKHTEDQAAASKKVIAELTGEFQDLQAQIRQRSPRYAALTQPAPLALREIQALLDNDTLLLEYALGDERSYLWAVTPTSINSFELPKRSVIEGEVRRAVSLLSDGKQWSTSNKVESEYAEVAGRLSRMLLDPVAPHLKGKRLVIVADGALQYLPYSALPRPRSGTSTTSPLIADFEIVNLPSTSTLAILRRETANRPRGTGSVAVIADPVFEGTDQRVLAAISQNKSTGLTSISKVRDASLSEVRDSRAILERAFRVESTTNGDGAKREVLKISRLPFTRFEAEGILASAPRTQSFKATDFRANRATATSADLSKYRYIHFATHGILNTEHPELSGVVLSLVDEKGQPVDGFLRLHEIYNLNLPADLVVLSACQTGLGKEIRGEGLVGLTRGFMYAGSPRVVASLWKVDDAATAELMKRFYRGMLKDNLRPAAALRLAKIEMWKQKRWNAPFYWAAFELQGEWK